MEDCIRIIVDYVDVATVGRLAQVSKKAYFACQRSLGESFNEEKKLWNTGLKTKLSRYFEFLRQVAKKRSAETGWYYSESSYKGQYSIVYTGSRDFAILHAKDGLRFNNDKYYGKKGIRTYIRTIPGKDGQEGGDGWGKQDFVWYRT